MAKNWIPDPSHPVGQSEKIGRRIWDAPQLRGAKDQPPMGSVDIENFREKRSPEVSLDRLGRTGIERRVLEYLQPRCESHANGFKPRRTFDGWAVIKAKDLTNKWKDIPKWELSVSPVAEEDGKELSGNRYHAHARCHGVDHSEDNGLTVALQLRHLYERFGELHPTNRNENTGGTNGLIQETIIRIKAAVTSLISRT